MNTSSSGDISSQEEEQRKRKKANAASEIKIKRKKLKVKIEVEPEGEDDSTSQDLNPIHVIRQLKQEDNTTDSDDNENDNLSLVVREPLNGLELTEGIPENKLPIMRDMGDLVKDYRHMGYNTKTGAPLCQTVYNKWMIEQNKNGDVVKLGPIPHSKDDTSTQEEGLSNNNNNSTALIVLPKKKSEKESEKPLRLQSMNLTEKEIRYEHIRLSDVNPWQIPEYNRLRAKIQVPHFYFTGLQGSDNDRIQPYTQDQLNEMLREKKLKLPVQHSELESALLAEAGVHIYEDIFTGYPVSRNFPSCSLENECFGMTLGPKLIEGLTEPIKLMSMMFAEQYLEFTKNGTIPEQRLPCVLCCRSTLSELIHFLRANRMQGKEGTMRATGGFQWKVPQVFQIYRNLKDQEGGYPQSMMLKYNPKDPVIDGLVELRTSMLYARKNQYGRWFIDQSALKYKRPVLPKPNLGDSLSDF